MWARGSLRDKRSGASVEARIAFATRRESTVNPGVEIVCLARSTFSCLMPPRFTLLCRSLAPYDSVETLAGQFHLLDGLLVVGQDFVFLERRIDLV